MNDANRYPDPQDADLYEMARTLDEQDQIDEAEPLYRRALDADLSAKGGEHLDVARDLTDLAGVLRKQGKNSEAEAYYRRALRIVKVQAEPSASLEALLLANISLTLFNLGRSEEAYALYQKAKTLDPQYTNPPRNT